MAAEPYGRFYLPASNDGLFRGARLRHTEDGWFWDLAHPPIQSLLFARREGERVVHYSTGKLLRDLEPRWLRMWRLFFPGLPFRSVPRIEQPTLAKENGGVSIWVEVSLVFAILYWGASCHRERVRERLREWRNRRHCVLCFRAFVNSCAERIGEEWLLQVPVQSTWIACPVRRGRVDLRNLKAALPDFWTGFELVWNEAMGKDLASSLLDN